MGDSGPDERDERDEADDDEVASRVARKEDIFVKDIINQTSDHCFQLAGRPEERRRSHSLPRSIGLRPQAHTSGQSSRR